MRFPRPKLTYANVIATFALFVALGGAAVAAGLPKNSVGTNQLKRGAISTAKLKRAAVTSGKIAPKAVSAGKLGANLTTEEGKVAARSIAIDLLATLHTHVGDLNRVTRIVKLMSLVNSTLEFTEQHLVTNGASELIADVFGERGKHARSAFGVAQIPMGACVEIEMIAEVA